jgi:putative transposase
MKSKSKNKSSPGQMKLPWDNWEIIDSDISKVAEKFVKANCTFLSLATWFSNAHKFNIPPYQNHLTAVS